MLLTGKIQKKLTNGHEKITFAIGGKNDNDDFRTTHNEAWNVCIIHGLYSTNSSVCNLFCCTTWKAYDQGHTDPLSTIADHEKLLTQELYFVLHL